MSTSIQKWQKQKESISSEDPQHQTFQLVTLDSRVTLHFVEQKIMG